MRTAALLLLHASLLTACMSASVHASAPASAPEVAPAAARTVPAAFATCRAADGDRYEFDRTGGTPAVTVEGDALRVTIRHGGGCKEHAYQICWPSGALDGSDPVVAALEVWHDSGGDACRALVQKTVSVDLAPLKEAWRERHGPGAGTIRIEVGGETVDYTFGG